MPVFEVLGRAFLWSSTGIDTNTDVNFEPQEENVAALVLGIAIGSADLAVGKEKSIRPDDLWQNGIKVEVEAVLLGDDTIVTGTEDEKRALLASVYSKVPTLMRAIVERQRADTHQFNRDAEKL